MNPNSQIMSLRLQFDAELEKAEQAAYAEGRKDEREASCVDEMVAALTGLVRTVGPEAFRYLDQGIGTKTAEGMLWIEARAVLTKLEQTK